jgi:hypothetical protein
VNGIKQMISKMSVVGGIKYFLFIGNRLIKVPCFQLPESNECKYNPEVLINQQRIRAVIVRLFPVN